jgi:hypothetical protein
MSPPLSEMIRLFNYTAGVCLLGCWIVLFSVALGQTDTLTRPAIFDHPTDFSSSPDLPELESIEPEMIYAAVTRGVQFLLEAQNPNGSWGSATRTKDLNIYAPVPGAHHAFRMGATGLAVSSLIDARVQLQDQLSEPVLQQIDSAIDRCEVWMLENLPQLRRATGDAMYNVWGHAYGITALVRLRGRKTDDLQRQAKIDQLIAQQIEMLDRYESVDGGWGYYDFRFQAKKPTADSTSFVNGTVLVALHQAQQIGIQAPERVVQRAVAAIVRQQKPDFTYLYGEYMKYRPMVDINRPGGSLGRSQVCNLALRLWNHPSITENVIKHWLLRLYVRNGWLDIGRKRPVPHESWFAVAGYFYYYGHYYAALSIQELPESEQGPYKNMVARLLLPLQEENGAWWDYPLYNYHEPYGTGYAIISLLRCLP